MRRLYAPTKWLALRDERVLFLTGSIEMGKAEDWQLKLEIALSDVQNLLILNPRRPDWDPTWVQSIDNPQFREQVEWELDAQDRCTHRIFYFDPDTKSPIALLELGLAVKRDTPFRRDTDGYLAQDQEQQVAVCCPEGFWRRANVEITCKRYGVPFYNEWGTVLPVLRGWFA